MLLGEQLGGRHHGRLVAGFGGPHGRKGGDDRFAAAHIALYEPQHRTRLRKVMLDLMPRAQLCACKTER